ncbi:hypothetical protein YC2023_045681 [Brassica napus]
MHEHSLGYSCQTKSQSYDEILSRVDDRGGTRSYEANRPLMPMQGNRLAYLGPRQQLMIGNSYRGARAGSFTFGTHLIKNHLLYLQYSRLRVLLSPLLEANVWTSQQHLNLGVSPLTTAKESLFGPQGNQILLALAADKIT